MKKPKSFTEKIKVNNALLEFNFEENGSSDNSWYRIFSKVGEFENFNMVQNINKNPQEYIIINRTNIHSRILKIEKDLCKTIQKYRK